jgi:SLT domain-containing protein
VVAAFQLIEQTANILSIAFSGLEGATLLIRDVFSRINRFFGGGSSEKRRELEGEQASWSERNEEKLNRPREAFERHTNSGRRRTRGRREAGGPVQRNQSYLVGERGPEIFTPQASGNIIPNINLGSLSNSIDSSVSQVAKFFRVSLTNLWNSAVSPAPGWISSSTSTISKTFTQIIPNAWKASSSGFSRSLSDSIRGFGQSIGVSLTQTTKRVDFGQEILRALITNIESLSRRETGGPVNRGRAYLVGERGPELFIPSGDGSIVSKMGLMGSGNRSSSSSQVSANFNVTIQVNGGLNAGNVESLRGPVLAIIQDAWKEASTGITSRGAII